MNTTNPLEIHIHLEDGRVVRFIQQDAELAQQQLAHLQPTKLFAQPVLMLGGSDSFTAFQMTQVARVEFIAEQMPDYPFYRNVLDIQQVTLDEFRERYHPKTFATLRQEAQATPDKPITVFSEMELVNGERLFFQVCVKVEERLPIEQGIFVSQLFSSHGLHARLKGGGILVVNPANIARFTLYPSPLFLPPGTWEASRVISVSYRIKKMKETINLLEAVALLSDLPERGLYRGQVGAVVEELAPDVYEVEFTDMEGRTYAMLPLKAEQLMILRYAPAQAARENKYVSSK